MRFIRLNVAILAIVSCCTVSPTTGRTDSLTVRNCTWCHGGSAQGYAPAPRLAGQRSAYIENQLASFREHTRDSPFSKLYMWGAAAHLDQQNARNLAIYFSSLFPEAANDGDRSLVATGRSIYQLGLPDSNIVACVACHGPNAEGIRDIPRLGGLSYSYLKRRLVQWKAGYHGALSRPMPDIASRLNSQQIAALASYLSYISYPGFVGSQARYSDSK
jgi:cytochrome c553